MTTVEQVEAALVERYNDLRRAIAAKMYLEGDDAVDQVLFWTVEKALKLAPKYDSKKASCWTWLCLIAYGQVSRYFRDKAKRKVFVSIDELREHTENPEDALIAAIDLKRQGVKIE